MPAYVPPPVVAPPPVVEAPKPIEIPATQVGLLLPLSGDNAKVGQALLNAAQLALFDVQNDKLTLVPEDTGTTNEGAARAARALTARKVDIIVGPLGADQVINAAIVARAVRTPLLGFSTDRRVAGNGVYLLGFPPEEQATRIISYAGAQGLRRFAALIPSGDYGDAVLGAFRNAVATSGGQVAMIERFNASGGQPLEAMQRLADASTSFDALFVPTSAAQMRMILPLFVLTNFDPSQTRLLGTGLWDDPALAGERQMQGAWFAGPPPNAWNDFASRYRRTFGDTPPRVVSSAYDAVALASALGAQPRADRFTAPQVTQPSGFAGVDGVFRFGSDGMPERGLAVMEVNSYGPNVLDQAPGNFGGIGF
ncbi:penicillin-binding protein activator [Zavarzinia sp. CC-PAN008]|uniref:penicillin-binding protein activator n=1 Tax=Zavarzinia sp. CC-PAN008 TaxID=3243332 RepID=UPI003F7446AC